MPLRAELMPPILDEGQVVRLAELAARIDGAWASQVEDEVAAFNAEAGTSFTFVDFQGIYGGQEHETWVRGVLSARAERPIPDITREELLELIRRIAAA